MTDEGFKTYSPQDAPRQMMAIAEEVIPRILAGDHPILAILRQQYERANITKIELSGVGFFIHYQVPDDVPRVSPANFEGYCALIDVEGVEVGAGCDLFVSDGRIDWFEAFTFGDGEWWEDTKVLSIKEVRPWIERLDRILNPRICGRSN